MNHLPAPSDELGTDLAHGGLPDERETTAANLIVVGGDELSGVNLKGHADNRTYADDGHRTVITQ